METLRTFQKLKKKLLTEVNIYRDVFSNCSDFELIPKRTDTVENVLVVINLNPRNIAEGKIYVKVNLKKIYDMTVYQGMEVPIKSVGNSMIIPIKLAPGDLSVLLMGKS